MNLEHLSEANGWDTGKVRELRRTAIDVVTNGLEPQIAGAMSAHLSYKYNCMTNKEFLQYIQTHAPHLLKPVKE